MRRRKQGIRASQKVSCPPLRITRANIWLNELNVGDNCLDSGITIATYDPKGEAGLAHPSRWPGATHHGRNWLLSGKSKVGPHCPQRRCYQVFVGCGALARSITKYQLRLSCGCANSEGTTVWLRPVSAEEYNTMKWSRRDRTGLNKERHLGSLIP